MDGKIERDVMGLDAAADADLKPAVAADLKPAVAIVPGASAVAPPPAVGEGGTAVPGSKLSAEQLEQMTADIVTALKSVYDPEIPSDIYELGLIYKIDIDDDRNVAIDMTLTAPGCPVAGVQGCTVKLTFDPPWDQSRMSDEARLALNMF